MFKTKPLSPQLQSALALVAAGVLAYGLLIPSLGFFQDDWQHIFYWNSRGSLGMLEFLTIDGRPTAAWCYALLFPILGSSPLRWHIFVLALRTLAAIIFVAILKILWPNHQVRTALAGFFLLLHPFFILQSLAVAYAIHWASFTFLALSILLTIRAVQNPKRWLVYTALAILAETLHLFTVEYFVGLEALRPFVIWAVLTKTAAEQSPNPPSASTRSAFPFPYPGYAQTVKRTIRLWLPYLLILLLFLYWRTALLGGLGLRNNPMDFSTASILSALQNFLADAALVLVASWFKLVDPSALELNRARNFVLLAITLFSAILAYLYSRFLSDPRRQSPVTNYQLPPKSYLLSSILALLLGLAPAYAANFILHLKLEPWNGRFALAALPGAGMLAALAFESLFTSERTRRAMFAILIGLLIGFHNRVGFDFKASWDKQVKLYEQLTWRAPFIEPGTAIITDQEILGYMGDYPTSFALNTIYHEASLRDDTKSLRPSPYWFFAMSENLHTDADSLIEGVTLTAKKYASTFAGNSRNSLIIVFEPEKNQCLWILRPEDAAYRGLPEQVKKAAQVSNLSRIRDQHDADPTLYRAIVPENPASWCFHYQRADLARQAGDWEQVIFFWELAERGGYAPGHGFEYIPFIQGYAHQGNWKQALALTKQSNRVSANMKTILCPVWEELAASAPESVERDSSVGEAMEFLGCR